MQVIIFCIRVVEGMVQVQLKAVCTYSTLVYTLHIIILTMVYTCMPVVCLQPFNLEQGAL